MIHIGPAGRKADNADNNGASLLRTIVVAFPPARPAQGIRESAKLSQSADPMALSCGLFLFSRSVGEKRKRFFYLWWEISSETVRKALRNFRQIKAQIMVVILKITYFNN